MKINLAKLHEGLNRFNFQVKPEDLGFDEKQETLVLFPNDINADIEVQKFSDKYFIKAVLLTFAHYVCDRCLDEFDENLEASFQLIYSKQTRDQFDDDEYRFFGEDETEIDLSNDARENLLLVIPMKQLCKDDCMGLCSHCGINLNHETCNCNRDTIDPRWEVLKSLQ
ncbi:MAG: DUF177 domain-containing protein [bacterium]|nr:MAG: DUF177 domain-containing protein [bacterium]